MNTLKRLILCLILPVVCALEAPVALAQPTFQDCLGAIPVCSSTVISSGVITGTGNVPNEINPLSSCLLTGERNDSWYLITIGNTGLLQFSVIPNNLTENYNWALYNLTSSTCGAIFTNPALEVECNYSALTGITGANGLPGAQNHPAVPVTAGQIFVLNVSAFSSINQSGYIIDFTGSTAGVIDTVPPSLATVSAMNCGATSVGVTFSEMINCNSVSPAGFQITGPGGPYTITGVTAANCSAGGQFSRTFTITFSPALTTGGLYTLNLLNPVSDMCGNTTPLPQSFSFPISALSVNFTQTNVTCFGGNNGSLTANVSGSTGPFTYQWAPFGGSSATAQFLTAGNYTVTVTNAGGCSVTASATITQPLTGLTASAVVTPASGCAANGSATVTVNNGQPPFIYSWWPSGGNASTASGLTAGGYMVTITDANQCVLNYFLNIPSASGPGASITASTDVSCFGGNNGSATVSVTGASGPFTYLWSPSGQTTATATSLTAGNYSVSVTLNATCILTASVVISQPPTALTVNPVVSSTSCGASNGSIQINTAGGVPTYNYNWSGGVATGTLASGLNPGSYTVTVTDANGCSQSNTSIVLPSGVPVLSIVNHANVSCHNGANGSSGIFVSGGIAPYSYIWSGGQNTSVINGLTAGTYTVTVTDAAGCSATLTDIISQPPQLNLSQPVIQAIRCFGMSTGSASFTATGGVNPYIWLWTGGVSTGSSATGLNAGTYSVTVTDQNGCSQTGSAIVTQPAAPITVQATIVNTICGNTNGTISVITSGGTAPYSYLWNTGVTGSSLSAIAAGVYSITVTDNSGCTVNDTYTVQASGAPVLSIVSISDVTCFGGSNGSVQLSAAGGVLPYMWSWSGGVSNNSSASGLTAGSYMVTVTDSSGCQAFQPVSLFEPTALTVTVPQPDPLCQGGASSLISSVSGGTQPYTYNWSTGATSAAINVAPTVATGYTLTVTDGNGCVSAPVTVSQLVAGPLQISAIAPDTICQGTAAAINVSGSGGDGNYHYQWSNGMSGSSNTISLSGPIQLTITITDGCNSAPAQTTISIATVTPPVLNIVLSPQKGCMPFTATFNPAVPPVTGVAYQWNFGDGTTSSNYNTTHTFTSSGVYNVSITAYSIAAPACSASQQIASPVTVLPVPEAKFSYSPQVPTVNQPEVRFNDESVLAHAWKWNFGDNTAEETIPDPVHNFPTAGSYRIHLEVTTSDGCIDTTEKILEVIEEMQFFVPNAFTADNNGINDVFDVVGVGFVSYEMLIFDRWGKVVHESKNGSNPWDGKDRNTGKPLPQGLYICKITMHDKLGNTVCRFSHVMLLR
ncbi:MAG TPA: PKD domain-containing protein [Bacteroidia bacterium]|nr:PKD domain-containing protein [Bacteroidia bacterium]